MARQATREISYAHAARTRGGRALIRTMENATGRLSLIKQAAGYEQEVAAGADFWDVLTARYDVSPDVQGGSLANIPRNGPLIVIANHPFGILDGLMMGHILSQTRGDFRILAHEVFRKADDISKVILPVSFDGTKGATRQNLTTRKAALSYLAQDGAVGVFPGGTVSTSAKPFGAPLDPVWRSFTAKLVNNSDAHVLPLYFDGVNSRLFQLASHAHMTLRMGLLIREFRRRAGKPVPVVIGDRIPRAQLEKYRDDPKAMMDFLRQSTYDLSPTPMGLVPHGFEFEDRHRRAAQNGGRHI